MRPRKHAFALSAVVCLIIGVFLLSPASRPGAAGEFALQFDGLDDRVTFGAAPSLGASSFTLELWFMRTGAGVATSTGTGGVTAAVPLVSKGRAEADGSNLDMNYFLGIDSRTRVLAADFEDRHNGGNHPVYGRTALADNIWYHAAATYDGTTWRLYLNGELETEQVVPAPLDANQRVPRFDSLQHAALGTAMTSTGVAAGFFRGQLDEVRIWNVARTAAEIAGTMNAPLGAPPLDVLGRWGLDDGAGTVALNSVAGGVVGSLLPLNVPPAPAGPPVWVAGGSGYTAGTPPVGNAISLTGTTAAGDYVTWERGPFPLTTSVLGSAAFTVETWFKRDATGVAISTGTGGITAVPIVTKGRGEAENSNRDFNYFLGINTAGNVLAADFEEGAAGASPGLNHPISGSTALVNGVWYHGAVTYDGTTLRLYLNGVQENATVVGQPPRADSIQPAALGTGLDSAGAPAGFFAGTLDEARIWGYARSAEQIAAGVNREIPDASGLMARWSFDDGFGKVVDSTNHLPYGLLVGTGWSWVTRAALPFGAINAAPTVDAGADQAVSLPVAGLLSGSVVDDGVNTGTALSVQWTQTSGPAIAAIANAASAVTGITFPETGTYQFTLSASDGEFAASDSVTVTVTGIVNQAPVVDAGADQAITLPTDSVALSATAADGDGPNPVTTLWSKVSGPGAVTFADAAAAATTATFASEGSYVLQVSASDGLLAATDTLTVTVAPDPVNKGLHLAGTNAFVTFGAAPGLGAAQFTIETWFRRDGAGVATTTGTGGVVAIPLVTKGMAQADGSNVDMNYFLGIRQSDGVLVADFEDTATGLNHPVIGTTPIPADGQWRHAAASFDGTTWRIYLDGAQNATLTVGSSVIPRADSIQHAALGTALNSTGGVGSQAQGFFHGALDEARIWNYARSLAQIASGTNREIPAAAGLLGRWSLNEGAGTVVAGVGPDGTIPGTGFAWVSGAHVTGALNAAPVVDAGPDQAVTLPGVPMVIGSATDDAVTATPLTTLWSQVSGPATAVFGTASNAVTTVEFPALGVYVLRLTANDSELSAFDDVEITVGGVINQAPVVDAGPDQTIALPANVASLSGSAIDDGVPPGGPVTLAWTVVSGPGTVSFGSPAAAATTAAFSSDGAYVLRLSASDGVLSASDTVAITVAPDPANMAIDFGGSNAYVAFGEALGLGAARFTIETWFRRDAAGVATFTGTGGVTAIPLLTKGMAEVDQTDNRDMNYFLGIRQSDGVLTADFEDTATGGNHPVVGQTPIPADGTWRHAAATYDGTTWRLYLDGVEDASLVVGAFTPRSDSIQHAALGTALNSTGGVGTQPQGFFAGALDEARVWNYARSPQQISHGRRIEIGVPVPGLLGRWGLNDGAGVDVGDSAGSSRNGTVTGSAYAWVAGAPFVAPLNQAPAAADDAVDTSEDTAVTISVLANDTDADGDAIALTVVETAAHGTVISNADGSITYQPAANFDGTETFSYTVNDGQGGSAGATVTVTVAAVNDAPHAANDAAETDEDTPVSIAVLANDSDGEGSALTPVVVTPPAHGTAVVEADGRITYTPAADFNGGDSFTYKVTDGTDESAPATVAVTVNAVNDAAVGVADAYTVDEDGVLIVDAPGVLGNDGNVDGDALSATIGASPVHGSLTFNADGSFVYTPDPDYHGADGFTYRVNDGVVDSADVEVTIAVASVNDGPVAADDSYTTNEDVVLTVAAPGVLGNDGDADGDVLQAAVLAGPAHGTLAIDADGSFTYTPNADASGPDGFTYTVSDGQGGSATASVAIAVAAVNDAPAAAADSFATNEDTALTVTVPGVLANDSDAEGATLSAVLVAAPAQGTLALSADGSFSYAPAADFHGTVTFTYQASDGTELSEPATVTIAVAPVNDAPVAVDDVFNTPEDTPLTVAAPGVLGNDADVDGPITALLVDGPANGTLALAASGGFVYTPAPNFFGTDAFTYRANDGVVSSGLATVTINVIGVTDALVAHDDSYGTSEDTPLSVGAPGVLGNDSADDGAPAALLVTGPLHGTLMLQANGSFTYTPAAQYTGSDSFTYRISAGGLESNVATVSLTIAAVNDAPVAADNAYSKNEDTRLVVPAFGVLTNDTDADNGQLTAILVSGTSHGTVSLAPDGSFVYDPAANFNGTDSFTYRASDGVNSSNVATVTITVVPVNDAPVAAADSYVATEDAPLTVAAPGLLANDTDIDSASLRASKVSNPLHGTVVVNSDGSFVYTPAPDYDCPDSFTYRARDAALNSNTVTVTLMVMETPDAPVANNQSRSTAEDTNRSITLTGSDADNDPITFQVVTQPSHGNLIGVEPFLIYVPDPDYHGPDSFTFRASDGTLQSSPATVTLTVRPVNDAPVALAGAYTTPRNVPFVGNAVATDVDGDSLTYSVTTQPTKGILWINASTGGFLYIPLPGRTGADSFRFRANDGRTTSNTATVSITLQ